MALSALAQEVLFLKHALEDSLVGPIAKYRHVLDKAVILTSTYKGFRTIKHAGAINEQTKKEQSYFYPKREVETDEIILNH